MEDRTNDARENMNGDRYRDPDDRLEIGSHDPRRGEEDRYPNALEQAPMAWGSVPKWESTLS